MLLWHCKWRKKRVSCPLSSTLVFCSVSTIARRSSADQLCSAVRRTLRAYTTPSSVLTRCSSVTSFLHSRATHFHLSASFGAALPDPFTNCGRTKLQHLSTIRTSHRTTQRGLCFVASQTRNEPSCVSNNPVSSVDCLWSVFFLRAILHCCQHLAHCPCNCFS